MTLITWSRQNKSKRRLKINKSQKIRMRELIKIKMRISVMIKPGKLGSIPKESKSILIA
jgi:hypothetical protein